ncbi:MULTISPECIES: tyrosine-type recombinase/integrase [unclassified Microbacterium]|uniref:tyrosine-type recombinase/integrase n=1 Tax=Microbacterium TaxID=33882 RepID=UPI003B9FAD64
MAEQVGVSTDQLVDLLTTTLFPGAVYTSYGALIAERRYQPGGFTTRLGRKDVHLALDAARTGGLTLLFGKPCAQCSTRPSRRDTATMTGPPSPSSNAPHTHEPHPPRARRAQQQQSQHRRDQPHRRRLGGRHGASTIKNSIAPLVRVLDEAVRDGLIPINPAKNRAKRSINRNAFRTQPAEQASPRAHAIPTIGTLTKLADACGKIHQSYSDFVMLAALLAARSSEVSGLQASDVRFDKKIVVIARQTYPGKGGLITKQTKGRRERLVPILDPLRPILERLAEGKEPEDGLLVGPKGGALTTATVRDATNWDQIVKDLGLPDLTRHGLRHTGATWMADAGIPLHVLQDVLGHASVEITRGYLHPDDRRLASAAEQANTFSPDPPRPAGRAAATRRGPCDAGPGVTIGRSGPLLGPLSTGETVRTREAAARSAGRRTGSSARDQRGTDENPPLNMTKP